MLKTKMSQISPGYLLIVVSNMLSSGIKCFCIHIEIYANEQHMDNSYIVPILFLLGSAKYFFHN